MDEIDVKECVLKLERSDQGSEAGGEHTQLEDMKTISSLDAFSKDTLRQHIEDSCLIVIKPESEQNCVNKQFPSNLETLETPDDIYEDKDNLNAGISDDISDIVVSADSELRVTSSPQETKRSTQFSKMEDKLEIMNQKLDKILSLFNVHSEVIAILCGKDTPLPEQTYKQHPLLVAHDGLTNVPTRSVFTNPAPTPSEPDPNDAAQTPSQSNKHSTCTPLAHPSQVLCGTMVQGGSPIKSKKFVAGSNRVSSRNHYAWLLAQKTFPRETLIKSNSRGISRHGCKRDALDPVKMATIRQKTFLLWPLKKGEDYYNAWRACEKNIDTGIRGIRKLQTPSLRTAAPQMSSVTSDALQTPSVPTYVATNPSVHEDESKVPSTISSVPPQPGSSTALPVSQSNMHPSCGVLQHQSKVPSGDLVTEVTKARTKKFAARSNKGSSRNHYAWLQAQETFSRETLLTSSIRGKSQPAHSGCKKDALDPVKMSTIRQKAFVMWPLQKGEHQNKAWRDCERTIDICISYMVKKLKKSCM